MKVDIWQETKYKTNTANGGVAILIQRLQLLDEDRFIVKIKTSEREYQGQKQGDH
ncbi:MAG: hypothetical protein LBJ36_04890 [Synergistaceae bacterium]|jgi:hypothetical protein|nr:hypothetical protein [Synergistaceae bacterium]